MDFYRGCTALITGASSGIGLEFAQQLAPYASRLILVARRVDRLEQLRASLQTSYPSLQVSVHRVDLADEGHVEAFFADLEASGAQVNLLINNAGLGDHGAFEKSDWGKVRQMLSVNIIALTRFTHRLLPMLRRSGQAAILNVSSIAGLLPIPDMTVYAATKAYVNSFSEGLRAELRGTGVSVTALCPGPVNTEFSSVANRETTGEKMPAPEIFKVPVEEVVATALHAVEQDRARVIPGLLVAVVMTIAAAVPLCILRHFLKSKTA